MHEDPIATLERELVAAARRRARPSPPIALPPARLRRRRGSLGSLVAVTLSVLALVVALGALVSLHGRQVPVRNQTSPAVTRVSSRQQLLDIIGVLRRPQTPADLPPRVRAELTGPPFDLLRIRPDLPLVRYATTTPWGEKLYLVPTKSPTREGIGVLGSNGGAGAADAARVEAGRTIGTEGTGRWSRVTLVVPDGVATVKFVFRRQPQPGNYRGPIYRHSLTVSVPVHDNVAAVQIDRLAGLPVPMIWYAADGHVIKQLGDPAGANRVVPPPQPGPETPLSRAAERDPSTPNRVWVTPTAGGPHAVFMVHFLVLLTGAQYRYQVSGTRCPSVPVNPGSSGGGNDDLRGETWSTPVSNSDALPWCPGTYHVSVSIAGRGTARRFGTATFTVRP